MTANFDLQRSAVPPTGPQPALQRRQLLRMGLLLGMAGLAGCARTATPTLMAAPETLPLLWRRRLVKPWHFSPLESSQQLEDSVPGDADLLALPDGWVSSLRADGLQPLKAPELRRRLSPEADRFLQGFASELSEALLPVSVSPWVMVFRGQDLVGRAQARGWEALLDPALAGQLVLPASPRVLISLADRMERPDALRRLRIAARVFDDRQAMNWLLQGKARVAVLPLVRCVAALRSDPRVQVVLPSQGALLHWTLLMRTSQSLEPLPQEWVEEAWRAPLLGQLLAEGWRPPLPHDQLELAQRSLPARLRPLVLPPPLIWERCWSFSPLSGPERARLSERWSASAP